MFLSRLNIRWIFTASNHHDLITFHAIPISTPRTQLSTTASHPSQKARVQPRSVSTVDIAFVQLQPLPTPEQLRSCPCSCHWQLLAYWKCPLLKATRVSRAALFALVAVRILYPSIHSPSFPFSHLGQLRIFYPGFVSLYRQPSGRSISTTLTCLALHFWWTILSYGQSVYWSYPTRFVVSLCGSFPALFSKHPLSTVYVFSVCSMMEYAYVMPLLNTRSLEEKTNKRKKPLWRYKDVFFLLCSRYLFENPEGRPGCLMSLPCLESRGCHLIPFDYLLSCFSA